MALLGILPTWVLFRYAPRNTRHTLPQGFFIQVFLCVLNLVLSFIILLPFLLINYLVYFYVSWAILIFYYVIAYKQLFGYGIWGTLWRVLIVFGFIIFVTDAFNFVVFYVDSVPKNERYFVAGVYLAYGLGLLGVGWAIDHFSRKLIHK